jgi:hypothetical protein
MYSTYVIVSEALQDIREPLIKRIIDVGSEVLAKFKASQPIDIQIIYRVDHLLIASLYVNISIPFSILLFLILH